MSIRESFQGACASLRNFLTKHAYPGLSNDTVCLCWGLPWLMLWWKLLFPLPLFPGCFAEMQVLPEKEEEESSKDPEPFLHAMNHLQAIMGEAATSLAIKSKQKFWAKRKALDNQLSVNSHCLCWACAKLSEDCDGIGFVWDNNQDFNWRKDLYCAFRPDITLVRESRLWLEGSLNNSHVRLWLKLLSTHLKKKKNLCWRSCSMDCGRRKKGVWIFHYLKNEQGLVVGYADILRRPCASGLWALCWNLTVHVLFVTILQNSSSYNSWRFMIISALPKWLVAGVGAVVVFIYCRSANRQLKVVAFLQVGDQRRYKRIKDSEGDC